MKKYVLAYKNVKTTPVIPECGYVITNSLYPELNGTYTDVIIPGINRENYEEVYEYTNAILSELVNQEKIDNKYLDDFNVNDYIRITSNGTHYILESDTHGYITLGGLDPNDINWYYRYGGGGDDITNPVLVFWEYNVSPGIQVDPQSSTDWANHTFPTIVQYGEYPR